MGRRKRVGRPRKYAKTTAPWRVGKRGRPKKVGRPKGIHTPWKQRKKFHKPVSKSKYKYTFKQR